MPKLHLIPSSLVLLLALASVQAGALAAENATLDIKSVAQGGNGWQVTTADGTLRIVMAPIYWPTLVQQTAQGQPSKEYHLGDPFLATLLHALKTVRPAGAVDANAVKYAIQTLTIAPLVLDSNWSDTMITAVKNASRDPGAQPRHGFVVQITKHGTALEVTIDRATATQYATSAGPGRFSHSTVGKVAYREFDVKQLSAILHQAKVGKGVNAAALQDALTLLDRPTSSTTTPEEQ